MVEGAWIAGVCVCGRGHAWQGACVAGTCVAEGHAWWRGRGWQGCACVAGDMHGKGACVAGACVAEAACMATHALPVDRQTPVKILPENQSVFAPSESEFFI